MYKIAILGASGYTGAELIRIIYNHPEMEIVVLAANSKAGQSMKNVFPHLRSLKLPSLIKVDEVDFDNIDLCFCALPHKTSQEVMASLWPSVSLPLVLPAASFLDNLDEAF